jgi:2-keto-4-pentenoate hydratase/2-oxohepta-3-ene-1,7-dioic acid hydratase in catechol pathway
MRLATIRTATGTRAVRIDGGGQAVETGDADLRALLERPDWPAYAAAAAGPVHAVDGLDYAPLVPAPEKILCVGQNYRDHIAEMGNEPPAYPTVFAKFAPALVGAHDEIVLPAASDAVDYEAELAVVIGRGGKGIKAADAMKHVWGYTIVNDVTARDWQSRHMQWHLGKSFDTFCPMGPWLVSADEIDGTRTNVRCYVNGEERQNASTTDLIFGIPTLIETLSAGITLYPGDVIATGTPVGVGIGFKPPKYLKSGDVVRVEIDGIGVLENPVR